MNLVTPGSVKNFLQPFHRQAPCNILESEELECNSLIASDTKLRHNGKKFSSLN